MNIVKNMRIILYMTYGIVTKCLAGINLTHVKFKCHDNNYKLTINDLRDNRLEVN